MYFPKVVRFVMKYISFFLTKKRVWYVVIMHAFLMEG